MAIEFDYVDPRGFTITNAYARVHSFSLTNCRSIQIVTSIYVNKTKCEEDSNNYIGKYFVVSIPHLLPDDSENPIYIEFLNSDILEKCYAHLLTLPYFAGGEIVE